MPCCCATNLKAAHVLGIVLTGVSLVPALAWGVPPAIICGIYGILSALVHGVLVFGTYKRHTIAILVWMVLACLSCIGVAGFAIFLMVILDLEYKGIVLGIAVSWILVHVWTLKVAYDARKEIEEAGKTVNLENQ